MSTKKFDQLVNLANEAGQKGDWQQALDNLRKANRVQPDQAGVLSGMGTCYLELLDYPKALECFLQTAALLPTNADVQNNLGLVYQLNGRDQDALAAHQKAVQLDSSNWAAWKNLAALHLRMDQWEQGVSILASLIRTNPQDIDAKFLLAQCYEIGGDFVSARAFYEAILREAPEHAAAREAFENLPADSSPEAVAAAKSRIVVYAPPGMPGEQRMQMVALALMSQGENVKVGREFNEGDLAEFDHFIFTQPNLAPEWINAVEACIREGKPFGVDLEQDYFNIPNGHIAYSLVGPGSVSALSALKVILREAAWVSVASKVLAERLTGYASDVRLNPPTWNRSEPLWQLPAEPHKTFNIGWIGFSSDYDDLGLVRDEIVRFLRAHPAARILVAGDEAAYNRFGSLPEKQRQHFSLQNIMDIPAVLRKFDVLLAPWQPNQFNQAKSDQALLEAGIYAIPWVASPIPAYREWAEGGMFAEKPGDWLAALEKLAGNPALRQQLGSAGRAAADRR